MAWGWHFLLHLRQASLISRGRRQRMGQNRARANVGRVQIISSFPLYVNLRLYSRIQRRRGSGVVKGWRGELNRGMPFKICHSHYLSLTSSFGESHTSRLLSENFSVIYAPWRLILSENENLEGGDPYTKIHLDTTRAPIELQRDLKPSVFKNAWDKIEKSPKIKNRNKA